MNKLYNIEYKKTKKRAQELKKLLLILDSICDDLYNNIKYPGIFECINKLEDIRIKYYTEYYEYNKIVELREKR